MTRTFLHSFEPATASPITGTTVDLEVSGIEDAGIREVLQTPGAAYGAWSIMDALLLLDEACRATKDREATPVAYRLISRGQENAGYCHQDPPANVMPLDKVIDGMKAHLANVKIHHERGAPAKWLREVTSFQDQLRTTWSAPSRKWSGW